MPKSKSIFKAFKSSLGPLLAPGTPSGASRSGRATPSQTIPNRTPSLTHDLVLNNLATTSRLTKDIAEAFDKVPFIKALTGVVAQIINIHEEVQGNTERRHEIISMVTKYAYAVIECLAELYAAEGVSQLEALKAELMSFQSYLEAILINDLESLENQSRWKAYIHREKDMEDMRRIERELKGFVDRFKMMAVTVSVRDVGAATKRAQPEIQQTILREHWLRSQHAQYNIAIMEASPGSIDWAYCAPGTREAVLQRIVTWACDRNPVSPAVFWMVGEGGTGKSAIARTIARKFDEDNALPAVITFFCSRKFSDTTKQVYIIPTLAYQLAQLCPFYSSELLKDLNIVDSLRVVSKQMDSLLIQPWEASSSRRPLDAPSILVIIDALDEILSQAEGDDIPSGFTFLKSLLMAVERGHLKGIKFFITSRPDPKISEICRSLSSEATCRLYDIPKHEVEQDIYRYLHQRLPRLQTSADHELLHRIAAKADGLFIFATAAALVASPTPGTTATEQRQALKGILDGLTLPHMTTNLVNTLYCQIIGDAFEFRNGNALSDRLNILHTIICLEDRVSIDVLVKLVSNEEDDPEDVLSMVEELLHRLHAVLWISDGHITWYHDSFLDFLLSPASASIVLPGRKLDASCDVHLQHGVLARRCFSLMRSHLKFNMCQLPSSFLLDSEVEDLATRIKDHISPVLRYACRYWAIHTSKSMEHGVRDDIERFLDENLLFWIETMNLVQQSSLCTTLVNIVQQYAVQNFPDALNLCKNLSVASHFSSVFNGSRASESTPHLYLSTLVYTAPRFPLLRKWRTQFSYLPDIRTRGTSTQVLMTLTGHTDRVKFVSISFDGTRIVSGSDDRSVQIWDIERGEEIQKLSSHAGSVNSAAFSPGSDRVVSGSSDRSVRIWHAETGEEVQKLSGHTGSVSSVAFSPDSTHIVSGSEDLSVRVWNIETGEEIKILIGHTDSVNSVAFSSDGTRIVSGSDDRSVLVWDVNTGEKIKKLSGHTGSVNSVAFSSDNGRIASCSDDRSVRVWDFETAEEMKVLSGHKGSVHSVNFSPDSTRIVSGSDDRSVRIWDVETGEEVQKLSGHTDWVNSVLFSSDGTRIVSGSDDRSVRVWAIETEMETEKLKSHTGSVSSVAFSPDSTRIVSGSYDRSIRVWDIETGWETQKLSGHTGSIHSVAFSPDGIRIVSGSDDRSVQVWDVETGEAIKRLNGHTSSVYSVAFSPDSFRIVSGSSDRSVQVWDVETGKNVRKLSGHTGSVHSVAFSSDGIRIVSGSNDCSVRVWDVEMGEEIKTFVGHTNFVHSVAFSPDGFRIVSGSSDRYVQVWDVETGVHVRKLSGHTGSVHSVAFSPDGTRIVSGSYDRSVRVWDVNTGEEIKTLSGHQGSVHSVAFSTDDTRIASGSLDKSVRIWDLKVTVEPQNLPYLTHEVNSTALAKGYLADSDSVIPTLPQPQLNWTVKDDGWIVQLPTMNRIMWLPDNLTAYLYRPDNTLIISEQTVALDFSAAGFGVNWKLCYHP